MASTRPSYPLFLRVTPERAACATPCTSSRAAAALSTRRHTIVLKKWFSFSLCVSEQIHQLCTQTSQRRLSRWTRVAWTHYTGEPTWAHQGRASTDGSRRAGRGISHHGWCARASAPQRRLASEPLPGPSSALTLAQNLALKLIITASNFSNGRTDIVFT